jgi:serine/threonine protein kinase
LPSIGGAGPQSAALAGGTLSGALPTLSASTGNPPEVFGKYHLLEKIATGGMAEVWRARAYGMAGFEKILVIKKVLPNLAEDDEFIKLFIDEARIAVQLLHVNIVQVFDLGQVEKSYYMAMEYVHGLDLSRLVTRSRNLGPFPVPLALFVIGEVCKALQFAHDRVGEDHEPLNVVHCDISPQNILVSYAGEVKLTDFGISRAAFQADAMHKVVRGKYAYMSPEQVDGRALDRRTDIFSLGIVLYETLTGRRLFKGKTRDQTLDRVRRAEVPSPRAYRPEFSEDLEALLLRCLARRPDERFYDAGELLESLSALMVREGHRSTNNDLAAYLKAVIDSAVTRSGDEPEPVRRPGRTLPPSPVVVLSAEASPPPRSIAGPRATLAALTQEWAGIVAAAGGELWERGEGSLLVVWVARGGLRASIGKAVQTAEALQKTAMTAGYRLSAGLSPGVARIAADTRRPPEGWELAGPFYLARWMMNLSAHRGRVLLTEVGAKQAGARTSLLGRIPIQGNRYINLHELG